MNTVEIIALVTAIAWASGINLYATIFILGIVGHYDYVSLPSQLELSSNPIIIGTAGFMYFTEFVVDKIPGLDSLWDTVHTFIRIPAGAILSMSAVAGMDPVIVMTAFLLGGTLAAGSHATKSGSRLLMQSSPEPVSNWTASVTEDVIVVAGIWTALNNPWVFLTVILLFICMLIWLLPGLIRVLKKSLLWAKEMLTKSNNTLSNDSETI
ncbi:MAG: DUF4126 domain-containing protein [Gammaproteobacteria bacterium]